MKTLAVLLFVALVSTSFSGKLPADYKICRADDPNLNECLRTAVQGVLVKLKDGNPDINASPFDPLNIPSVTIGEGKGVVNLVQNYKNFNILGLSNAQVETCEVKISPTEFTASFDVLLPEVSFEADYDINGRILLLPVVGNGKCTVKLEKLKVKLVLIAETYEKKGTTYLKAKDVKVELNPGKVSYNFENLFNGDKRLGDEINNVLNDNWLDIFNDISDGYIAMLNTTFRNYANNIFGKVPFENLFPTKSA